MPFGTSDGNPSAYKVWAVPGGWEALVGRSRPSGNTVELWATTDASTWRLSIGAWDVAVSNARGAADADGQVLIEFASPGGGTREYRTKVPGGAWRTISDLGGCKQGMLDEVLAPRDDGVAAWVVLNGARLCTSHDLQTWTAAPLPWEGVNDVGQTRHGLLAIGESCYGAGRARTAPTRHPSRTSAQMGGPGRRYPLPDTPIA